MYSILVNPTHAVTGALAPSTPLFGFIFSFSRDLIFFSFSLFLIPLWLCAGNRPIYLIDFAPVLPRFHRSPWAHTHLLCPVDLGPWRSVTSSLRAPPPPDTASVVLSLSSLCSSLHPASSQQPALIPTCGVPSPLALETEQGFWIGDAPQRRKTGSLFPVQDWPHFCPSVFSEFFKWSQPSCCIRSLVFVRWPVVNQTFPSTPGPRMSRNKIIKRAPGWVDFENVDRYRAWGVKAQSFTERGECGRSRLAQTLPEHSPLAHTPLDSWMPLGPSPSRGWRERKGALLSLPASLALCFFLPSRYCFFFFFFPGHTMVKQLQMPRSVYTSSVFFF